MNRRSLDLVVFISSLIGLVCLAISSRVVRNPVIESTPTPDYYATRSVGIPTSVQETINAEDTKISEVSMESTSTLTVIVSPSETSTPLLLSTLPAMVTPLPILQPTNTSYVPIRDDCDPAYPGVCIPPPPPDLNCGDVSYKNFQVLRPDPHGFDRNNDGIGCEN